MPRLPMLAAVLLLSASAAHGSFVVFEAAGADAAAITPVRDGFRTAVGGDTVAGLNGSFGGQRREINWDGVPNTLADPAPMPGDFFNSTSPRGVEFSTPGTGFMVSTNSGQSSPVLFGFPNDFQTFSAQRLFTAIGSNVTEVSFFLPGTSTAATTSAFGLIFVDVESLASKVEFFDQDGAVIFTRDALLSGNQGLSFLGAVADAGERIGRVRITAGLNTIISNGILGNPNDDVVVMDDFLYAEPLQVPEPPVLLLLGLGLLAGCVRRGPRRGAT